ncbi:SAV_2336 family protein [Streptomyces sp. NBC_01537]|uniref:SAV_2336 N-terminal domain-related protein n=1 Tax=Streptomyces sp. NBC_01537 TaxID=2903896 RepID=UPI00386F0DA4
MPDPVPDPIAVLAGLLRQAGLDPAARELADAVWLARWAKPTAQAPPRDDDPAPDGEPEVPHKPGMADRPDGPGEQPDDPAARPVAVEDPRQVALYAGRTPRGGPPDGRLVGTAVPVRVPAASALPGLLELQRALRPLQRFHAPAPPVAQVLDEEATADLGARTGGLIIPVFRADRRRETTMRLVMDTSSSMAVWGRLLEEIRQVCEQLGAFRDVQVHYLHRLPDGTAAIATGPEAGSTLRSAEQLSDPTGRGLTVLVSDCAGPLWHSGEAHRLLYSWGLHVPVAVLQPLPPRLWARTRLPAEVGVLRRDEGAVLPLRFTSDRRVRADRGPGPGALPVPVLPPTSAALGAWARLLSGTGAGSVRATVAWVRPGDAAVAEQPVGATPPGGVPAVRPPLELVGRFRSTASPTAVQLAVYLSAAPLTLPVMQLVQRTMLPGSGPADLAEVLLSGLLVRVGAQGGDPSEQWYEFLDGVRDVLLGPLGRDEATLVLKHCSAYVEQHFGKAAHNFPALAVAHLAGASTADFPSVERGDDPVAAGEPGLRPTTRVPQPFATVPARVVLRYLPSLPLLGPAASGSGRATGPSVVPDPAEALRVARELMRRYDTEQTERSLFRAVQVLRRTVAAGPSPDGLPEAELSGALLRLWEIQRDPELLAEARTAVERALLLPGTAGFRAVLARVLQEQGRGLADAGERDEAAELLQSADRHYAAVCALPDLDAAALLDATLRRARTLQELAHVQDDQAFLLEALSTLEALGAADGPPASALRLELGGVLLALAEAAPDPARRTGYAERAADHLQAALTTLAGGTAADRHRSDRARLDLAAALTHLPGRLDEALDRLRPLMTGPAPAEHRVTALLRAARARRVRHEESGDPADLDLAAAAFEEARRMVRRDSEEYAAVLADWGETLLTRAALPGGQTLVSQAVRVLRDARAETPERDARAAEGLLLLGTALRLRHTYERDAVDLREAEHILELAARTSPDPLREARAWREHGDVEQELYERTGEPGCLEQAGDSYRRAWRAALRVDQAARRDTARALAARVNHLRGEVLERMGRPRSALDAYRTAADLWRELPAIVGGDAERTAARIRELGGALP